MLLSGTLKPVDSFYGCQLCLEGRLLVSDIAGALGDGGALSLVVRSDNPSETCSLAEGPVSPGVTPLLIPPGLSPGGFQSHARGIGFDLTTFGRQVK
jgi:hypothetical protein